MKAEIFIHKFKVNYKTNYNFINYFLCASKNGPKYFQQMKHMPISAIPNNNPLSINYTDY